MEEGDKVHKVENRTVEVYIGNEGQNQRMGQNGS